MAEDAGLEGAREEYFGLVDAGSKSVGRCHYCNPARAVFSLGLDFRKIG